MKRRSLPPVGALNRVESIKPIDKLYLVSPAPGDGIMAWIWASADGVEIVGSGSATLVEGLAIWNRNVWEPARFYVASLNLSVSGVPSGNTWNDAYLFFDYELANKFADWCSASPDGQWADLEGGLRRRTGVLPFLSRRDGEMRGVEYDRSMMLNDG